MLKRAVQNAPDNAFIIDSLGWLYYQKSNYKKALQLLTRANKLVKDEPVLLEHLADTYQKIGKKKEALEIYKKIVRLSGDKDETLQPINAENQLVNARAKEKVASLNSNESF